MAAETSIRVFPARAGVILLSITTAGKTCGIPRTGGGDPALFSVAGALGITVDAFVLRGIALLESLTLKKWRLDAEKGKG